MSNLHPVFAEALRPWMPPANGRIRVTLEWIPVHEEFPEPGKTVLVSVAGDEYARPAFCDGSAWCMLSGHEIDGVVTHWARRPVGITP